MLITRLREGYNAGDLRADALAGLTVAIVALPLSMAIAIASGLGPERGLFTAIVGGFLVSCLGGARHQVGGPAGAFIVLVAACVAQIGVPGLVLATVLSGLMLILLGLLRLGNTIRFIPYPVTLGFTAGIGVIILLSQMKDLFGLHLSGAEPGPVIAKVEALWAARGSLNPASVVVAVLSIALIQALRRWRPRWPNLLIAVVVASVLVALLGLPVETIASRFGSLPRVPPVPSLPPMDAALVMQALPWAVSFTLLGAIESLLSAMVADGMTGGQHRSNVELVAQGVANIGAALFGGMCVTGTIARTATNVRAGSRGPVSGMLHALFVLGFMLIAAPLAGYIPLPALAGVLVLVAWGMIEREECAVLIRASRSDAAVLAVTFLLVVFRDLSEGIVAGFALGGLVFIRRMAEAARVEAPEPAGPEDAPSDPDIVVHHLRGVMFFGAAALLSSVLDRIAAQPRALIVDLGDVPFVDSTAARMLVSVAQKMARRQGQLYISAARPALRAALAAQGLEAPAVVFCPDIAAAQQAARQRLDATAA